MKFNEPRKSMFYKKLLTSLLLILLTIAALFFILHFSNSQLKETLKQSILNRNMFQQNISQNHKYKISISHNGKPIEVGYRGLAYYGFDYYLGLRNETNLFVEDYIETAFSSELIGYRDYPNYTFISSSKTLVYGKTLKDYENLGYAFDITMFAEPSDTTLPLTVFIGGKNFTIPALYYKTAPKLSNDFSINLEVPFFNKSSFNMINDGKSLKIHIELLDDWTKNNTIYCQLWRTYDNVTDASFPNCPSQEVISGHACAIILAGWPLLYEEFSYKVKASREAKKIDCNFSLTELPKRKNYYIAIGTVSGINENLVQISTSNLNYNFVFQ